MNTSLLRAAVDLDEETRVALTRLFADHRDAAAREGRGSLAAYLAELVDVTHEAGAVARRERVELDVAFAAVLGIVGAGPCDFDDAGSSEEVPGGGMLVAGHRVGDPPRPCEPGHPAHRHTGTTAAVEASPAQAPSDEARRGANHG